MQSENADRWGEHLDRLLEDAGITPLNAAERAGFETYLSLFLRWNARINLSSVRDPQEILSRHIVESIACAQNLPQGISTLLDFGSGGGLPGIPIAICRSEIAVTLAESQGKRAAFLQEAVRTTGIVAKVFAGRAETLTDRFDCVVLRAVDRMGEAVESAGRLVDASGWLALMTTHADLSALQLAAGNGFDWLPLVPLPSSGSRVVAIGHRLS